MSRQSMHAMRERFRRVGQFLDQDERERASEAALRDAGEKIERSAKLSWGLLADYRRLLENPLFAAAEDERAWHKADLHHRWRRRHGGQSST